MGRSDDLMIGETVIAIGNPFGLSHTVTTGVVSATNRTIKGGDGRTYTDFVQIDASINPGNSGGPLLNLDGELIGINAAIYQSAEGIGFAIPIDKAKRIVGDLIHYGEVHRAWIGLQVQEVDEDMAAYFGLSKREGVLVKRVFDGSPADRAGIKRGDLVTAFDGHAIVSRADYLDRLAGFTADSEIKLSVRSGKAERTAFLRTQEVPKGYGKDLAKDWLGVGVAKNSDKWVKRYNLATAKGVVITDVFPGGPVAEIGIKPGDVIRSVNEDEVDTEEEFYKRLLAASHLETVVLVVQRGRVAYNVPLNP
jgi:serine protease Do